MKVLEERGARARPVLLAIGEMLVPSTKERLNSSQAPDGSIWDGQF